MSGIIKPKSRIICTCVCVREMNEVEIYGKKCKGDDKNEQVIKLRTKIIDNKRKRKYKKREKEKKDREREKEMHVIR